MRERVRIFFLLAAFWLSFMIAARVIFLFYNFALTAKLTPREIGLSMLYGLRMDASISGYFLAAYGLLLTISALKNASWIAATIKILTITLIILCSLIIVVDMELYHHWGFRLNTTPFMYLGKEAVSTVPLSVYAATTATLAILAGAFIYIFRRKIYPYVNYLGQTKPRNAMALLGISAMMFIPIRGSFTVAPMNPGFVYYHNTKPFANHAAVNVIWSFLRSLKDGTGVKYSEHFFSRQRTESLFSTLHGGNGKVTPILNTAQPNVLLIILESFTADVVEPLGGVPGVTPHLNQLCREGVLFDSVYSSGDRTDKGLISILSGFPAQPLTSVIKYPSKSQRLPLLNHSMKSLGYHTSFIYGGDIDFAYFRSYLNTSSFEHITELDDFDSELYTSKWGVHDHYMFDRAMHELDTTSERFFKVILTLSSHEPFDVPAKPLIDKTDPESLFLNSCHYTDASLNTFINYCKRQPWWNNTLIVITADHGHRFPGNKELYEKERFRIPLLFIGGAVQKDTVIHTTGSQTDIANTLLGQLGGSDSRFTYSKNLLEDGIKPFAAYFYNDGYGFVTPQSYIVYDNQGRQFLVNNAGDTLDVSISKAYQQKLYTDFNTMDKTRP